MTKVRIAQTYFKFFAFPVGSGFWAGLHDFSRGLDPGHLHPEPQLYCRDKSIQDMWPKEFILVLILYIMIRVRKSKYTYDSNKKSKD